MSGLQAVFGLVREYFDITTKAEHHCSTHIHVSPREGFTLEQLRQVSRGIFIFQDEMLLLIPDIGASDHSRAFSRPVAFEENLFPRLGSLDFAELIDNMTPDNEGAVDRKYVAWNFLSLKRLGTVEWRQGPPCHAPRDAVRWVILVLSAFEMFLRADFTYLRPALRNRSLQDRLIALLELLKAASRRICRAGEDPDLEIADEVLA